MSEDNSRDSQDPSETKPAAPKGRRPGEIAESFWTWLVGTVPRITLLARLAFLVALFVVASEFFARWSPPFWPFTTTGAIFVDSPEVYTRERLVNDRYDQDHWLRQQLERLDESKNLPSEIRGSGRSASFGDRPPEQDFGAGVSGRQIEEPAFLDALEARASIRAILRQQILENMLDDRHDLSGNSLYGFKFDTTIIPGANTRNKAFVRMSAEIDQPVRRTDTNSGAAPSTDDLIRASLGLPVDHEYDRDLGQEFRARVQLSDNWAKSIENRLNRFVTQSISADEELCRGPSKLLQEGHRVRIARNTRDLALQALTAVLSLSENEILTDFVLFEPPARNGDTQGNDPGTGDDTGASPDSGGEQDDDVTSAAPSQAYVQVTDPWRDFIEIVLSTKGFEDCRAKPSFKVEPIIDIFFLIRKDENGRPPKWATEDYRRRRDFGSSKILKEFYLASQKTNIPAEIEYQIGTWSIAPSDGLIEELYDNGVINGFCVPAPDSDGSCPRGDNLFAFSVQSGTINLIRKLAEQDAYAYAMLPKTDATSVLVNEVNNVSGGAASGPLGWALGSSDTSSRSESRAQMVGFGDSRIMTDNDGTLEFGWILDPTGSTQPLLRTQMALISVPAYADDITFDVRLGWLDRNASQRDPKDGDVYQINVPLPPDFETFETIIFDRSNDIRRRPFIFDQFINKSEESNHLTACTTAQILIPGSRLWRSTAVTLGPFRASRIVVLPNMEGIIAQFDDLPPDSGETDLTLRVWTSEGTARSTRTFRIMNPTGATLCDEDE